MSMKALLTKLALSKIPRTMMNKLVGGFVPIFLLHRFVDSDNQPNLEKISQLNLSLEYLRKNNYQPIALEDVFVYLQNNRSLPSNSVVFTVDDGFDDQFEIVAPIFSKFDIPLTCFVITDLIDEKLWPWDSQVEYIFNDTVLSSWNIELPNGIQYETKIENLESKIVRRNLVNHLKAIDQTNIYKWLKKLYDAAEVYVPDNIPIQYSGASWQKIREFVKSGHYICAHSKTHRILSQLKDDDAYDEIIGSSHYLKSKIPNCTEIIAYPSGRGRDFCKREEMIVANSNLLGAVSAIPESVTEMSLLTSLPRFSLPSRMEDFTQYLSYIEVVKNKVRC